MKTAFLVSASLIACVITACSNQDPATPLFNGKDLTGWVTENPACWSVEEGLLVGRNDPEQKGDILFTEKSYRNFIVQVDFKLGEGTVDTGIFLRDDKEQIQIGESGSLKRDMTALPYIPALKGYPVQVDTAEKLIDKTGWNTLKVKVAGSTYTTWLNGQEIMTYQSETIADEGPIGIQVHPKRVMSVYFRNLFLIELPE